MLRSADLRMRFILNLLFLNMQLAHRFRIHVQGVVGVIPHILRVSYLLKKRGGIPPRQAIIKVHDLMEKA